MPAWKPLGVSSWAGSLVKLGEPGHIWYSYSARNENLRLRR